mgnify:CR=1 FL=1
MSLGIDDIKNLTEFGEYLRNAREQRYISIEQIHKETKIRTKYLVAMENGDFSIIPGGDVYVKGFLKNYSICVGIEPYSIIELYRKLRGEPKEEISSTDSLNQDTTQLDGISSKLSSCVKQNSKKICAVVVAAFFVIVSLISIQAIVGKHIQKDKVSQTAQTPQTQVPPQEEKGKPKNEQAVKHAIEHSSTIEDSEVMVEILEDTSQNTIYVIDDEYIEVTMNNITGRCWILVHKDGQWEFEGMLNSGDSKTWEAKDSVNIRIGNPAVVNLVVNGKDLGNPKGGARDFIFKRRT